MEYSLPWPGATLGHAGPYSVGGAAIPGWWDKAYLLQRAGGRLALAALADIGVYYSVDNQLECTEAADTISIDVDTGACLVDGTLHYNDTDPVNVPIPAAGAGESRIDLVVVRKNYSAVATYTPGGGAPTVPFRETHITVIRGTEAVGPVAPTVTQDATRATYWDIPLCSVEVDDAGALTDLTDLREYADAETKEILVPFIGTDGTALDSTLGWYMAAAADVNLFALWEVPVDFISDLVATPLSTLIGATGDIVVGLDILYGTCTQGVSTHNSANTDTTAIDPSLRFDCLSEVEVAVTVAEIGDFLRMLFTRTGSAVADTAGDTRAMGIIMSYLGWK